MTESPAAAASRLLAAYAWLIDDRRWTDFGEVFTDDVVADYEAFTCRGADALGSRMESIHAGLDATQHLVGSVLVTGRAGDVRVRSHVQATLVKRGLPGGRSLTVGARYDDRIVRGADGWRIAERRTQGLWVRGNRDILPWTADRGRLEPSDSPRKGRHT
ncbi:nuclear transport factor 2 family protein [Streptomyces carpinensis]|uniref:Nuclear transport factor 2 family protein n=1 Tax=Streptomyces carpinensis TaxID=66369 RepID=A0ABV1WAK2_9ACTN|nr:nuclear transport factor 2 family protein [Streptomyces carpinensis]